MTARTRRSARRAAPLASLASLALLAALVGCAPGASQDSADAATTTSSAGASAAVVASAQEARDDNVEVHDAGDAATWDASAETVVTLSGTTATVAGASAGAVTVDGSTVTLTKAGTYRLTGTLTDGQVIVDTSDADLVRIVLDGADLTSTTSAPLHVAEATTVAVVLADGTSNRLADAATSTVATSEGEDETGAALFSTADLTITGAGTLTVEGNANDGIASKDGLVIESGTIAVSAVDDGVRGKDYLLVESGTLAVAAGGDGLKADADEDAGTGWIQVLDGTIEVTAGDDGLTAATDVIVDGGALTITAAGGASQTVAQDASGKAVKGEASVLVAGGTLTLDTADDGLHSGSLVDVSGGAVTIAAADDGIHGDHAVAISAGTVTVTRSEEGIEGALITVSGGETSVVASDDGLNASDGSGATTAGAPGAEGAQAPADGTRPERPTDVPTDMPQRGAAPAGAPADGEVPAGRGGGGGMGGATTYTESDTVHLEVSGGTLTVDAGGDGLDSNGSLSISGGTTTVFGPTSAGNGTLDAESGIRVAGGTLVAVGSAGMAQAPDAASPQPWVQLAATGSAGAEVTVTGADGVTVATFTAVKDFGDIVVSTPELTASATYTAAAGGAELASGTASAGGAATAQ